MNDGTLWDKLKNDSGRYTEKGTIYALIKYFVNFFLIRSGKNDVSNKPSCLSFTFQGYSASRFEIRKYFML